MTTSNKQWRKKITRLSIRSQSVLPGGGGGLNPLSRRWSNRNLQFNDNFSISAVRLHHTYLASVERNVPRLFSIFLISRSLYFYLIIVKIFIFVILISRSLFYLIIVNVFIFVFLISRFLCFYPITIIISFFTYVYPKQLFNPFFTFSLAAERAKKLDDITGNWTWQRWVEKWKRWTKRILLLLFMMMIRMLLFSIWWGGWEWGWWLQLKQNCKRKHADQVESAPNINQLKPEEVEEVGGQVLAQPPQVLIYPIKF